MSWTDITKLNIGEPIDKAFLDAVIDNLTELRGLAGSATLAAGANGSFENDTDDDGYPDSWSFSALSNGTGGIYNPDVDPSGSDWSAHGRNSFRFVRSSGVGNGGGTLTSEDFFECSPSRTLVVRWQHKCSAAGVGVKVELLFYTRAQVFISASTVYSSTSNPTSWTIGGGSATPPATATYAKLRITGGESTPDVAASIFFDDVQIVPLGSAREKQQTVYTANGTFIPTTTTARIRLWGGGGGGGNGETHGGGGGGGGGYAESLVTVVPGVSYTVTIGAGGAGSGGSDGATGGTSSVGALISATGGAGGVEGDGSAGAGGTGGTGTGNLTVTGQVGYAGAGAVGGEGGFGALGGAGGRASGASNGRTCGGGGGGGAAGGAGSDGGDGRVVIEW